MFPMQLAEVVAVPAVLYVFPDVAGSVMVVPETAAQTGMVTVFVVRVLTATRAYVVSVQAEHVT